MVESHKALQSNIPYDASTHFPLENIPFGVFSPYAEGEKHVCTRVGD